MPREMWAVAAQHKKYDDALSGYNSLRDPHLNSYFRRPQIRHHLLRANIINKENKIVDEISSTKSLQRVERKQKKELYHLLEDLVKRNELDGSSGSTELKPSWLLANGKPSSLPVANQEEFIRQAKLMFDGRNGEGASAAKSGPLAGYSDSSILQRLDRMIRTIKEHEHITAPEHGTYDFQHSTRHNQVNGTIADRKLWASKSYHDISENGHHHSTPVHQLKSCSSSGHLSRESRPKSAYARAKHFLVSSNPDLTQNPEVDVVVGSMETMKKAKSCANIVGSTNDKVADSATNDDDIESVEGDSWSDSAPESDHGYSGSREQSKSSSEMQQPRVQANKYVATAVGRKLIKSSSRQKVKMTLKYNGLNGATNRGAKRSIKVFQQVVSGGNSILIYDGYINLGDHFTFFIRAHPSNSFSIIILVNGIRDLRLNACCEHKHRPGTKLSHFTFVDVVGGRPCFACQSLSSFDSKKADAKSMKYFDWLSIKGMESIDLSNDTENNAKADTQDEDNEGTVDEEVSQSDDHTENGSLNTTCPFDTVPAQSKADFFPGNDNQTVQQLNEETFIGSLDGPLERTTELDYEEAKSEDSVNVHDKATELATEDENLLERQHSEESIEESHRKEECPKSEMCLSELISNRASRPESSSGCVTGLTVITSQLEEDDAMNMIDYKDFISEETPPQIVADSDSDSEEAPATTGQLQLAADTVSTDTAPE